MSTENAYRLNIDGVLKFLPHRQPFAFIDRVLEIHPTGDLKDKSSGPSKVGIKVVTHKNMTYNEPFFQGHFPGLPITPGVILVEIMAQTASFSIYPYFIDELDRIATDFQCILVGVDEARFRRPVVPGDTLRIESVVTKCRSGIWGFDVAITCDGQKVAEAKIMANLTIQERKA